jgi:cytochrome P450
MISSEGEEWRRHRKILGPAFAEKSNLLVWHESLRQANGILRFWSKMEGNGTDDMVVKDPAVECAQLTLNVISGAGFGVSQVWQGDSEKELGDSIVPGFNSVTLSAGHTLSFKQALDELIHGILWVMLLPGWLLSKVPCV